LREPLHDNVSILIPAYNEASRLRQNIRFIEDYVRQIVGSYEIIIAEDGSMDGTDKIAKEITHRTQRILHSHSDCRLGKGAALKRALKASRCEIVVFMDADLATSLDHLPELLELIKRGYDGAIGSRYIERSCVKRPLLKLIASRTYNLLVRVLFRDGIQDHQCGFKAFSRQALDPLVADVESNDFFFDTELILKAKRKGFSIGEVPVTWREPEGRNPQFRLFGDGVRMGLELLKMRMKPWRS
jgi:hypothetical protein